MRSRRPRPSDGEQDYDSTPAEGLRPRCLILLPDLSPRRPKSPRILSRAFSAPGVDLPGFLFLPLPFPAVPTPLPKEKFPLCIRLCPAFYISFKVKLTRATMTERESFSSAKVKSVASSDISDGTCFRETPKLVRE